MSTELQGTPSAEPESDRVWSNATNGINPSGASAPAAATAGAAG